MDVILLEKIRRLGVLGDQVKVRPGFARNYLVPQGKAVYANKANIAKFEQRRAELEKLAAEKHQKALARQQTINALQAITIATKVGEEGKLFGSVGSRDIVDALEKAGVVVTKREVQLPHGALRMAGEHEINIELESDVIATVKIAIVSQT